MKKLDMVLEFEDKDNQQGHHRRRVLYLAVHIHLLPLVLVGEPWVLVNAFVLFYSCGYQQASQ